MNKLTITALKVLRKIYATTLGNKRVVLPPCDQNPDTASKLIYDALKSDKPCMIGRFGAVELSTLVNYIGVKGRRKNILNYIKGNELDWWWNQSLLNSMHTNAGFFPPTKDKTSQFCELMLNDIHQVDILGSWLASEKQVEEGMSATRVHLRLLEPFWSITPWTKALAGKKVLVIHPFSDTILNQYNKRELLFKNKDILPKFASITVIKAVQSIGVGDDRFLDWFEALEFMKNEINKQDYDICLIGAGAYGFPLAAHVKRMGKKSVHMGGALQLLFGIKGKRWEDPNYGVREWGIEPKAYTTLINNHWVRPDETEKPETANQVEGACYW
tara:strand:+ start:2491 stop:3477 length:987 start_codon:yes stop_codon:yes gene_type:complete